ncbi:acyl carrier protein [Campylobacter jejuni]|nr:acyl carrier protein [Campylobacter jejuni]
MATFDDVKAVVVEQLSIDADAVKMESKIIEDLGADSLDVVELIMALEEKFEVEIPDSDAEKLIKIEDVVNYIDNLKKQFFFLQGAYS